MRILSCRVAASFNKVDQMRSINIWVQAISAMGLIIGIGLVIVQLKQNEDYTSCTF
jgi:hypothetical protein